eukprot:TRINITY_DN66791_c7_g2_i1.p2 TRINITY_DN66791_c7_g2~~TRINITY_DN66791_c7_g2_i1.p2  ORF type:complete len:110 (-),score=17.32 TRINITY_DN66791_c7_g2_i1:188-517(-)
MDVTSAAALAADVFFVCWLQKQDIFAPAKFTYDLPGFCAQQVTYQHILQSVVPSTLYQSFLTTTFVQQVLTSLGWNNNTIFRRKATTDYTPFTNPPPSTWPSNTQTHKN